MALGRDEARRVDVFISYSREDIDFADQLEAAPRSHKFEVTIDRHGISGGEEWKRRLRVLIRDADTVIFILSPPSAESEICGWEVSEAVHRQAYHSRGLSFTAGREPAAATCQPELRVLLHRPKLTRIRIWYRVGYPRDSAQYRRGLAQGAHAPPC